MGKGGLAEGMRDLERKRLDPAQASATHSTCPHSLGALRVGDIGWVERRRHRRRAGALAALASRKRLPSLEPRARQQHSLVALGDGPRRVLGKLEEGGRRERAQVSGRGHLAGRGSWGQKGMEARPFFPAQAAMAQIE